MAFTARSIADGQLASSLGTLYTVPALSTLYLKNLFLHNTNAATQTITLQIQRSGGTSRIFRKLQLSVDESASVLEGEEALLLSTGDVIAGFSTNASAVNYFLGGVLET